MKVRREYILTAIAFSLIILTVSSQSVSAHEEGGEGTWLLSSSVSGNLNFTPDSSIAQWSGARMVELDTVDMQSMNIMSVHNETYILFLVQRPLNVSLDQAGVLVAFEEASENGSDVVWAWVNGTTVSTLDSQVKTAQALNGDKLTVVFGRELDSASFNMNIGIPYSEFVKATSWTNGANSASIDLETLTHMDFELLPAIDTYPKDPIVIAALVVLFTIIFIVEEIRRYK